MPVQQDNTPQIDKVPGDQSSIDSKYLKTGYANEEQQKSGFSGISSQIVKSKGLNASPGKGVQSIFNDFFVVSHNKDNYPILETDEQNAKLLRANSFKDLIANPQGARIYKAADFVYCARHGMPINRMITLRRFAYPVLNDITTISEQPDPDIARLVTYMDSETNPITELLNIGWHLKWAEKESSIEDISNSLHGDKSGMDGFIGSMLKYIDPTAAKNALVGPHRLAYDPYGDSSKIYGPKDSIAKTTLRDVGLETELSFEIRFDYELRSINGVNQKRAFLDLLANILACTYNDGEFWGGARYWTGARPSIGMMKTFRSTSPKDFEDFLANGQQEIRKSIKDYSQNFKGKAIDTLAQIASNALQVGIGKLLDLFGRASIPQFSSLLLGEPTGSWHLTFGNPLNPIISIGNLILEDTQFGFDTNDFGNDDLPEKFHVTCKLKTGMPLDRAGLEQIFNVSPGRIYWTPKQLIETSVNGNGNFGEYAKDPSSTNNIMDAVYKYLDTNPTGIKKFASKVIDNTIENSRNQDANITQSLQKENDIIRDQERAMQGLGL